MRKIYVALLLMIVLGLNACDGNIITGQVTADLARNTIKNGEIVDLKVNGKNTGNLVANVALKIIVEDDNLLKVSYAGTLEETLQPEEEIGTRILHVQGFTQHTQTKLWIKTQLLDKTTGKVLDEDTQWITIEK